MANTIHTISILLRQISDDGDLTVGSELLPGAQGSSVAAGSCLLRKFLLNVDRGSELLA